MLDEQEAKLKMQREELQIQTALAVSDAKFRVLDEFEGLKVSSRAQIKDGMNDYLEDVKPLEVNERVTSTTSQVAPSGIDERVSVSNHSVRAKQPEQETIRPTYAIMDFLVKQQNLITLPPQKIPIFSGDPMEYMLFMRAFEHGVQEKTDSDKDRLYFLEQYTTGQPRELIRSCLHMEPERGYHEAKKLLKEHFGNGFKISMAYIDKALNWPTIKSEDGEALHNFGLYLTGCLNAMSGGEYMEELDNATNMHAIASKLPYKLRERWRSKAYGIMERDQRRAKFGDLSDFVNKQAKEALHPLFGNILNEAKSQAKSHTDEKSPRKSGGRRSYTTAATVVKNQAEKNELCAFSKPCIFCQAEQHSMEHCKKMRVTSQGQDRFSEEKWSVLRLSKTGTHEQSLRGQAKLRRLQAETPYCFAYKEQGYF